MDMRTALSTLWVFYVLNAAYGDITTLYTSVYLHPASTIHYTPTFILFGALIVEPAIVMVLLSRLLGYRTNRITNLLVGGLLTIVNVATLFVGIPTPAYAFITSMMILAGIAIVWSSWKWTEPDVALLHAARGGTVPPTSSPTDGSA